jgi:hypothetical protein
VRPSGQVIPGDDRQEPGDAASVLVCSIFAESTSVIFALEEDCVFTVGRHYSVNSRFASVATYEMCENYQSACALKVSSVFSVGFLLEDFIRLLHAFS